MTTLREVIRKDYTKKESLALKLLYMQENYRDDLRK